MHKIGAHYHIIILVVLRMHKYLVGIYVIDKYIIFKKGMYVIDIFIDKQKDIIQLNVKCYINNF